MLCVGGWPNYGLPGEDTEFCGLIYPDGDEITKHMAERLRSEPFYQCEKLAQALALLKKRRMAVDCGAWVGGWTRELAGHFDRVVSIEANPENARCVQKNVTGLDNVTVLNFALAEFPGVAGISTWPNGPRMGSHIRIEQYGQHRVQQENLDNLLVNDHGQIDYIKIHVNGMELKTLRGARETIMRHRPLLTVVLKAAIEDYGDSVANARAFLTERLNYRPAGGERPYELWVPA
jgi:FkbM family methyltransferase